MSKRLVSYRHTFINSIGTLLSRVTGLVRQQVINHFFGSWAETFAVAFQIPNTIRRNVGEGALTNAFVPSYQQALLEGNAESASRFASSVLNLFLLITAAVTVIGIVFAPWYFPLIVPGFQQRGIDMREATVLVMIMMPFAVFIFLFSIVMGILNSHKRFTMPAFAPVLSNVLVVIFPIFFIEQLGIYTLGIGTAVGGLAMFLVELFELKGSGYRYSLALNLKDPNFKVFWKLFLPTSANMLVLSVKDFVSIPFLSLFVGGAMIRLNAFTIIQTPLGIIGLAIGTVLLPLLSRFKAQGDHASFEKSLVESFYLLCYLTLPSVAVLLAYPDTVVNVLFRDMIPAITGKYGAETPGYLASCCSATAFYAAALFPMSCTYIFERIFYAVHDGKTLLIGNILTVIVTIALYFTSIVPGVGLNGVILAEAAASWLVFFYYLLFRLRKYLNPMVIIRGLGARFLVMTACAAAAAGAVWPMHVCLYPRAHGPLMALLAGCAEMAVFAGAYFGLTALFRAGLKR